MKKYFMIFLSSAMLVLGFVLVSGPAAGEVQTLGLGSPAPDFHLPGVDGNYYGLEDFSGARVLVVVFTCNHCPTAQAYEERIKELAAAYSEEDVALVAISPNDPEAIRLDELGYSDLSDSFEEMKIRAREQEFNFPYLYDGDSQTVSRAYGPTATPHVFIFDSERKLRYVGRVDNSEKPERVTTSDARNAIDALLANNPVPVKQTRTFGCSIKWSDKRESVSRAFQRWAEEEVRLAEISVPEISRLMRNSSDKLRLVNIWATWCGPCIVEFPELIAINRMYRNRDFEMITLSADTPGKRGQVLEFLKKQQASTVNYLFNSEDKYALIEAIGGDWPGALPYTVLLEPGGEIRYRKVGMIDPLKVKQAIVEYLGRYYE